MFTWLAGAIARMLASAGLRLKLGQLMLTSVLMLVLPIAVNAVIYSIMEKTIEMLNASVPGSSSVVALTGLAAWLAQVTKLPECLSLVVSAVATRVSLQLIPFTRLGS